MNVMIQSRRNYSSRTISMMTYLGCLLCGSCAGVNTSVDGQAVRLTTEECAEYAESTFRYHNQIVNEIITAFSFSDEDMTVSEALLRAEATRRVARVIPPSF